MGMGLHGGSRDLVSTQNWAYKPTLFLTRSPHDSLQVKNWTVRHWQLRQNAEKPEFGLARPACTSGQRGLEPERNIQVQLAKSSWGYPHEASSGNWRVGGWSGIAEGGVEGWRGGVESGGDGECGAMAGVEGVGAEGGERGGWGDLQAYRTEPPEPHDTEVINLHRTEPNRNTPGK